MVGILRPDHRAEERGCTQRERQRYTSHEISCEHLRGRPHHVSASARLSESAAVFGSVFMGSVTVNLAKGSAPDAIEIPRLPDQNENFSDTSICRASSVGSASRPKSEFTWLPSGSYCAATFTARVVTLKAL